jgi:CheY-like chemotaxis protein
MNLPATVEVDGSTAESAGRPERILVVDDEAPVRTFIEMCLRAGGFGHFAFAQDGGEVLPLAQEGCPHLIIMDVIMPRVNGLRALQLLKENSDTAGIPVIITSGFDFDNIRDLAKEQADLLLSKPFTPAQILSEVNRVLGMRYSS